MKLLNLNICMKKDTNKDIIKFINNNNFDIITFQESMRKIDVTTFDMYNSSNIIKNNIPYKNSFFGPLFLSNKFIKNDTVTRNFGGFTEQGNEIITNYSIVDAKNHFFYKDYGLFINTEKFKIEDHGRAFLNVILDINGKEIQIINIHGIWNKDKLGDTRTKNQIMEIMDNIRDDIPSIIVGDFNLLPSSESIQILNQRMTNLIVENGIDNTRYGDTQLVCDYIFVNDKVKVNSFKVFNIGISDHLPLVLDFEI